MKNIAINNHPTEENMIFKNKWEKKYNDLTKAFKEILLMQMKEGGEREIIANEILQSLSMFGRPLHWFQCSICNEWRPFEKISVLSKPILDENNKKFGNYNIRYCNDKGDCSLGADKKEPPSLSDNENATKK